MAALENPRHERFAQELAKGKTADEAYQNAGYKANRHNAAAMGREEHIKTRVSEIQERAAIRAEVSVAGLTKELQDILTSAKAGETAGHLNAARQSVMDIAKLNGLVIDKAEVSAGVTIIAQDLDEQL